MRTVTLEGVRLLPTDQLEQAHASVVVKLRANPDLGERQRLGKFLLAIDRERGQRRAQRPASARSGPGKAEEGESLAERLVEARESLFQESSKAEIRRRAQQAKRDMQTWKNRPNAS